MMNQIDLNIIYMICLTIPLLHVDGFTLHSDYQLHNSELHADGRSTHTIHGTTRDHPETNSLPLSYIHKGE